MNVCFIYVLSVFSVDVLCGCRTVAGCQNVVVINRWAGHTYSTSGVWIRPL